MAEDLAGLFELFVSYHKDPEDKRGIFKATELRSQGPEWLNTGTTTVCGFTLSQPWPEMGNNDGPWMMERVERRLLNKGILK